MATGKEFVDELSKVSRRMRTLFDARVKEQGLTLSRARLLILLLREDGVSQSSLAGELEIENPTLVRLLDSLEKQGLIERRTDKGDRRAKQIFLTAAGTERAGDVSRMASNFRSEILADLSDDDMAAAVRVFRAMTRTMTGE